MLQAVAARTAAKRQNELLATPEVIILSPTVRLQRHSMPLVSRHFAICFQIEGGKLLGGGRPPESKTQEHNMVSDPARGRPCRSTHEDQIDSKLHMVFEIRRDWTPDSRSQWWKTPRSGSLPLVDVSTTCTRSRSYSP